MPNSFSTLLLELFFSVDCTKIADISVYIGFDLEFDDKTQNSSVKVAYELIKRVDEKRYRILLQADYKIRITVHTWGILVQYSLVISPQSVRGKFLARGEGGEITGALGNEVNNIARNPSWYLPWREARLAR